MTRLLATSLALVLGGTGPVFAQQAPPTSATSLAVTAGASRADEATRPTFGGAARWELTAHFAIEGSGRWMDRVHQPDAYAAELCAVAGLGGRRDAALPYVVAGVGLQRRTFERRDGTPDVPMFYHRRLGAAGMMGERQSFTDPTVVLGVGIDVPLTRNVIVRPDVRALVVLNGGRQDTVLLATVGLGYRFEHRPVTPSR